MSHGASANDGYGMQAQKMESREAATGMASPSFPSIAASWAAGKSGRDGDIVATNADGCPSPGRTCVGRGWVLSRDLRLQPARETRACGPCGIASAAWPFRSPKPSKML